MLRFPELYWYCRHPRTHTHRHHWFTCQAYYALSTAYSALINHQLEMLLPPPLCLHQHRGNPCPYTR
jgi:hypothetical protein